MTDLRRSRSLRIPQLRRHKSSNRAYVCVKRRQIYLGVWGTPESARRYKAFLREYLADPAEPLVVRRSQSAFLWIELARRWTEQVLAESAGRSKDSMHQAESMCRLSLDVVLNRYESLPVVQFTPGKLLRLRDDLISDGRLCRSEINRRIRYITRVVEWAVEREFASGIPIHDLRCVKPLRRGQSGTRESKPIRPVSDAQLSAVLLDLESRGEQQMCCLLQFMAATGCRPGEAAKGLHSDLRLDRESGPVLELAEHKTARKTGAPRVIHLNQAALKAVETAASHGGVSVGKGDVALFRSKRGDEHRRFDRRAIEAAVKGACRRSGVEPWSPNRLRHRFADIIASKLGVDATAAALGHSGDSEVARKHYIKDATSRRARLAADAYEST